MTKFKRPKTAFAETEPKPTPERTKPTHQQCLGILERTKSDDTRCKEILLWNPAKRLCTNCTSRNAKQSRSVASQGGSRPAWKASGSKKDG